MADGRDRGELPVRQRRPGNLTGRALVLGVVVVLLALLLAAPLQRYLRQRDSLAQAEHDRGAATVKVAQLQQLKARWNDPRYVEQQARSRLQFARPGDTVYVVIDAKVHARDASAGQSSPTTSDSGATTWQTRAWTSLQVADGDR